MVFDLGAYFTAPPLRELQAIVMGHRDNYKL